ncbi:MAG: hypothetical protein VB948_06710, partial [Pseudomonadales bacterium]
MSSSTRARTPRYPKLGFTEETPLPAASTLAEAQAMGFSKEFEIIGADLTWPSDAADGPSSFAIRLQQWITPFDAVPSY